MRANADQIPLDLPHKPALGREDFLVAGSNRAALAMIERWPDWPSQVLLIGGPAGSGKSHLAGIWSTNSNARIISGSMLAELPTGDLIETGAVAVEDADRPGLDETRLFHLINAVRDAGAHLVITCRAWPEDWPVRLPDLASRLRLATPMELGEPDDDLLRQVLFKLLADRQVAVDKSVIDFLAVRMERSLEAAGRLVALLDREALAGKRRITRPLAARVLQDMQENSPRSDV